MAFDDPKQDTAPESGTCIAAEKSMPQNLKKPEFAGRFARARPKHLAVVACVPV